MEESDMNGNGKNGDAAVPVALALLDQKIETLITSVNNLTLMMTIDHGKTIVHETKIGVIEDDFDRLEKKHCDDFKELDGKVDDIQKVSYWWSGGNSVFTAIAAFMAAIK